MYESFEQWRIRVDNTYTGKMFTKIPEHTLRGLYYFWTQKAPTGGFLHHVLKEDMLGAACKADGENIRALGSIILLVHRDVSVHPKKLDEDPQQPHYTCPTCGAYVSKEGEFCQVDCEDRYHIGSP